MPEATKTERKRKSRKENSIAFSRKTAMDLIGVYMGILPDPDEVLKMSGLSLLDAYNEILLDDHLTAVMGARMSGLKKMLWSIDRGKASARVHKHVLKNFESIDVPALLEKIMKKNGWGMSPIEVKWESRDGFFWVKSLDDKPARWFKFDADNNEIRYISTKEPIYGEEIPKYRLLYPRNNPTFDNPYGERLFSKSFWLVTFKRNGLKWWNIGVEKTALIPLIGKVKANASDKEIEKMLDMLDNMVQDSVMVIKEGTSIEPLEMKSRKASMDIFLGLCRYMDNALSKLWLHETLTIDVQDKSTHAASKTHEVMFNETIDEDANDATKEANILIKWMVELNFGDVPAPVFKMSRPKELKKDQAERDKNLKDIGWKPNKQYFVDEYEMNPDHFEVGEVTEEKPPEFAFTTADQKMLDKVFESLDNPEVQKQGKKLLKPVLDIINNASSLTEALDNLLKAYPKMGLEDAQTKLRNAIFATEAFGHATTN